MSRLSEALKSTTSTSRLRSALEGNVQQPSSLPVVPERFRTDAVKSEFEKFKTPEKTLNPLELRNQALQPSVSVTKLPGAVAGGASDVNKGVFSTLRAINRPFQFLGSKLEEGVTGKKLDTSKAPIESFLTKQIEREEAVGQRFAPKKDATTAEKVVTGAFRAIPQVAPLLTGATAGQSLGAIGATSFGTGAREAEQAGATPFQQVTAGTGTALSEMASEYLPVSNAAKFVKGGGTAKDLIFNMLEEYVGEFANESIAPLVESSYNANALNEAYVQNLGQTIKSANEAGLTGATSSLLLGGSAMGVNSATNAINNPTPENVEIAVNDIEQATGKSIPQEVKQEVVQSVNKLSQPQIVQQLQQQGLDTTGTKSQQRSRLRQVLESEGTAEAITETEQPIQTMEASIEQPSLTAPREASLVQQEGTRKTLPSIQDSPMISEEAKQTMDVNDFIYEGITNEETLFEARQDLGTAQDFLNKPLDEKFTALDTAKGIELMRIASNEGDFSAFNKIALKQAEQLTQAGQAVQAASMLRRMTPDGYLQYLTREVGRLNETGKQQKALEDVNELQKAIDNATPEQLDKIKNILKKRKIKYDQLTPDNIQEYIDQIKTDAKIVELTPEESKYIYDKISESLSLEGRQKDIAIAEAYKVFEEKIPSTTTDKVAALQRISMLLNAKTQTRNIAGNLLMQTAEIAKEALAIPIDIATSKFTGERTLTAYKGVDLAKGMQGVKKGLYEAWDDYQRGINTRRDSGQFETRSAKTFPTDTRFKALNKVNGALNKANDLTSFLLSAGDRPFFEATYEMEKSRLERLPKYQGKQDLVEQQALATAEERTFQNQSQLAKSAVEIREKAGLFGRLVLPYAYTPANITDKVFDYSPLGSIRTVTKNLVTDIRRGEFNQREFAERASRNLTGSALMYLGFMLAKAGIITGAYSEDKDEREFQRSIGIQDYAFKAGDKQINFDWAQPIAVPFATGANLFQAGLTETNAKENIFNKLAQVSVESSKTLLEQPLLQGIQELFGGYGSEGILQNVSNIVKTAPLQVVPGLSLARQARQVADPTIRNIDYNSLLDSLRNNLPGASATLPAKFSTLGEEQQYSGGIVQKFVSPATVSKIDPTPLEQEILKVYQETGDRNVFPKAAPSSFSYKKKRYELTKAEQSQFQETMGSYVKDQLDKLMAQGLAKINPESKAKIISAIISDGYDIAKAEYLDVY